MEGCGGTGPAWVSTWTVRLVPMGPRAKLGFMRVASTNCRTDPNATEGRRGRSRGRNQRHNQPQMPPLRRFSTEGFHPQETKMAGWPAQP